MGIPQRIKKAFLRAYSDEALVDLWGRGDRMAGDELFERYFGLAIAYWLHKIGRKQSEDLVSITFERITKGITTQELQIENFKS
ncbi:MAG: hypothetical protein AAF242_08175, partial [Bacteroidota bacterium]